MGNPNNITTFAPPPKNTVIPNNNDLGQAQSTLFETYDQNSSPQKAQNTLYNNPINPSQGLDIVQT